MIGLNWDALDPGIRETVRFLRERDFETTDSGDGVTKLVDGDDDDGAILDVPHVWMVVLPEHLAAEASRLRVTLRIHDIRVKAFGADGEGVEIQATYDPVDGTAVIGLFGLNDALLATTPTS